MGQGCARIVWRMGLLFVVASLLLAGLAAGALLLPGGPPAALLGSLYRLFDPFAQFEPDEFVLDYALGAEVPRVYYLSIPRLNLQAPVVAVGANRTSAAGSEVAQLHVPNAFAVGWSSTSAPVGRAGNTVFVGHNNEYGEVFKGLWDLELGDEVIVTTARGDREYLVSETLMFQELGLTLDQRLENASWLAESDDERLTMITCWPYYANSHRVVVVARPAQ